MISVLQLTAGVLDLSFIKKNLKIKTFDKEKVCIVRKNKSWKTEGKLVKGWWYHCWSGSWSLQLNSLLATTMWCFDVVMLKMFRMALQPGGLPLMESSLDWMSSWNYDYIYVWWDWCWWKKWWPWSMCNGWWQHFVCWTIRWRLGP